METLQTALKSLRLGGLAKTLPIRYQEAKANELDYLDFLDNLVTDELDRRKENLLTRRTKMSKFPQLKTLDDFNFAFNTSTWFLIGGFLRFHTSPFANLEST